MSVTHIGRYRCYSITLEPQHAERMNAESYDEHISSQGSCKESVGVESVEEQYDFSFNHPSGRTTVTLSQADFKASMMASPICPASISLSRPSDTELTDRPAHLISLLEYRKSTTASKVRLCQNRIARVGRTSTTQLRTKNMLAYFLNSTQSSWIVMTRTQRRCAGRMTYPGGRRIRNWTIGRR